MGRGILRLAVLAGVAGLLSLAFASVAEANHKPRFKLFGTATHAKDPTDSRNHVIAIDTTSPGSFGGVVRNLNTKITALDDHLSVSYFFVAPLNCFGGSPRIQLAIDTNGDGVITPETSPPTLPDGNAFGYIGPSPNFGNDPLVQCVQNQWVHQDLTLSLLEDPVQALNRWDTSQLIPGTQTSNWDAAKFNLSTVFPNHRVLRGSLVADAFAPIMEGVAFYDDITIGYRTLYEASDTIGN